MISVGTNDERLGMPDVGTRDIAAVVVLYRPDADVLDNVDALTDQVDVIYAIDNTEKPDPDWVAALTHRRGVTYLPNGRNLGIATALNIGARAARDAGYHWALTMDQDSTVTPGMVDALARCAETDPERIAIVSPVHWQVGGDCPPLHPGCIEALMVMTSGNLVSIQALEHVGWFMDDLFIDQVDNELCLRFGRAGVRVVECGEAVLMHRVGDVRRYRFPYPAYSSNHSPVRRYYIARNRMWVGAMYATDYPEYWRIERINQLKEIAKILLYEREKSRKLTMIWRGYRDYRRGVTGRYEPRNKG